MARGKDSFAPHEITAVFISPETLQQQRIDELVAAGASGQEVAEAVQQTSRGEYREYLGEEEVNGKSQMKLGRLLQWVDDAPDDSEVGAGHYEVVEASTGYIPVVTGDEARERGGAS